jgi:hypothetical protein
MIKAAAGTASLLKNNEPRPGKIGAQIFADRVILKSPPPKTQCQPYRLPGSEQD